MAGESSLKICSECKVEYPEELVNLATFNDTNLEVCGICFLRRKNKIHGLNDRKLLGTQAELLRQRAIRWRLTNHIPKDK